MYVTVTLNPPDIDLSKIVVCIPSSPLCADCGNHQTAYVLESTESIIEVGGVPTTGKGEIKLKCDITKHPPECPQCGEEINEGDEYYVFPQMVCCQGCVDMALKTA